MTSVDPDEAAARVATEFAHRLVPCWRAAAGADLIGIYLIGSLAHGGFSRRYSDVDMAVVTEAELQPQVLEGVRGEAAALSADWGPKLSVFFTDRDFTTGRFPPLDRIDFLDRPVVLMERERVRPERPSLADIQRYLSGTPFANWTTNAKRFAAAGTLDPRDRKTFLRTLLYPARFCYSYLTGHMSSNDAAVAFVCANAPAGLDPASIEQALLCRRAAADPDSLFPLRTILPAQAEACAALLAHGMDT
jgi:predicted nucleotidyltransferase